MEKYRYSNEQSKSIKTNKRYRAKSRSLRRKLTQSNEIDETESRSKNHARSIDVGEADEGTQKYKDFQISTEEDNSSDLRSVDDKDNSLPQDTEDIEEELKSYIKELAKNIAFNGNNFEGFNGWMKLFIQIISNYTDFDDFLLQMLPIYERNQIHSALV